MELNPDANPGVEDTDRRAVDTKEVRELLDALAYSGIRHLELTAQNLRLIQARQPGNPNLLRLASEIRLITMLAERALQSAGYDDEAINHVPKSSIRPKPSED